MQATVAAALAGSGADLVVLDLGAARPRRARGAGELRQWSAVPVIVLSVRAGEAEKGARLRRRRERLRHQALCVQELMARIRALLRDRAAPGEMPPLFDDGVLRVDMARREVRLGGELLALSRKEYLLLALLVRHAGRVVTQPQILREVWGPTPPAGHALPAHPRGCCARSSATRRLRRAGSPPSRALACASWARHDGGCGALIRIKAAASARWHTDPPFPAVAACRLPPCPATNT